MRNMYIPIHMYYTITFAYKYTTYIGGRVKFLIMIFVVSVTVTNALVIRLVGWLRKRKFYENGPICNNIKMKRNALKIVVIQQKISLNVELTKNVNTGIRIWGIGFRSPKWIIRIFGLHH